MRYRSLFATAALLLLAAPARAQLGDLAGQISGAKGTEAAGRPDPALEAKMKQTGLKYEIDKDGDFRVIGDVGGGRTQLVFIISHTETVGNLTVREIWSRSFKTHGNLSGANATRFLRENAKKKIGAWQLAGDGEKQTMVYDIMLPADASPAELKSAISVVALMADQAEQEFAEGDEM